MSHATASPQGREFPRFLFSYRKLVGTKEKSKTDLENEAAGNDTSIERTCRLFYAACSRVEGGLAVVYCSNNPTGANHPS